MKITHLECHILKYPLQKPLVFSFGVRDHRAAAIIEIFTDEGASGIAEFDWGGTTEGAKTLLACFEERIFPKIKNCNPFEIQKIRKNLDLMSREWDRIYGSGAIDLALYDLVGKELKVPMYQLFGGKIRDEVPVYASALMTYNTIDELIHEAKSYVEQGFMAMKMRVGTNVQKDYQRILAVRNNIPSTVELMIDANCNYDRNSALRLSTMIENLNIFHFEEPLPKYDIDGYRWLSQKTTVPLAAGECTPIQHIHKLITQGNISVVQPDVLINGPTECSKIAHISEAYNLICMPHCFVGSIGLSALLHFAASMPSCSSFHEFDQTENIFRTDLTDLDISLSQGKCKVPDAPGLGIQINRDLMKKYQVHHLIIS